MNPKKYTTDSSLPKQAINMIQLNQEKVKLFEYCDVRKINNIDLKTEKEEQLLHLIEEYEEEKNYEYIECPHCNSNRLIGYGSYTRNVGILGKFFEIRIKRVKCKNCNCTHALIPSFIIPYFQNEVSFIEIGITLKEVKKENITEIEETLNVSRQLVYFWLQRFRNHLTRLKTTFSNDLKEIITLLFEGVKSRKKYYFINHIRFLEKAPT